MILMLFDLAQLIISGLCTVGSGYGIFNSTIGENIDLGHMIVLWALFFVSAACFIKSLVDLFRDIDKT